MGGMIAEGVNEYSEEMEVKIEQLTKREGECFENVTSRDTYKAHMNERWVVVARNEAGYNCTQVDLLQLIEWVKKNKPELLKGGAE